jgi:two-component system, OmpR family, response regulator
LISGGLNSTLASTGYRVDLAKDGFEANLALSTQTYDLVILDLTLPRIDGFEILKRLRGQDNPVPVLILSARDTLQDRVKGLDLGANDYLTKPFELPELEARVRALIRQVHFGNRQSIKCGDITLELDGQITAKGGQDLQLSEREVIVLGAMLRKAGKVVSKAQLLDFLLSKDLELTHNALDIVVHRLRKKIEGARCSIRTLRGLGYLVREI